ncbi:P-loop containing nucleoside triphosphate hydrolase protein [Dacryopinax primogenitus]|uniref:RNA helicase n=1 Tax=Dacryopinax primogenitus (strain DJM 731) TaxID=1858805 RepID=M5GDK6_DACPD|nr:P-loop containing nucleoside triphosphate hydrolase protein [Dacryopinax primogenitus]EJU04602.1 P-loop containing nucleoside triphosphate hydrolase protein [Dacryopinax primogenitus]
MNRTVRLAREAGGGQTRYKGRPLRGQNSPEGSTSRAPRGSRTPPSSSRFPRKSDSSRSDRRPESRLSPHSGSTPSGSDRNLSRLPRRTSEGSDRNLSRFPRRTPESDDKFRRVYEKNMYSRTKVGHSRVYVNREVKDKMYGRTTKAREVESDTQERRSRKWEEGGSRERARGREIDSGNLERRSGRRDVGASRERGDHSRGREATMDTQERRLGSKEEYRERRERRRNREDEDAALPTAGPADTKVRPFTAYSPPLSPGLLQSVTELLGTNPPSPIQTLSLNYFFPQNRKSNPRTKKSSETLLGAETGSGKTLAYLLPVLQSLKETEQTEDKGDGKQRFNSPRALILAPTHELCRQLAASVKQLTHIDKLRTVCFSNPIPKGRKRATANDESLYDEDVTPEDYEAQHGFLRPADVVVGTPSKMLEMFRLSDSVEEKLDEQGEVVIKADYGESKGLDRVQWVVVDEADVSFGKNFRPATRALLHFVREARLKALGRSKAPDKEPVPQDEITTPEVQVIEAESAEKEYTNVTPTVTDVPPPVSTEDTSAAPAEKPTTTTKVDPTKAFTAPPFNLVLSTATVSSSLGTQLAVYHPRMIQLLSPNLHKLPATLRTEHVSWSGGNRTADVAAKIFSIWTQEARAMRLETGKRYTSMDRSKILIFCNTASHAEKLGRELGEKSISTFVLTSESTLRRHGSNKHLEGFLKVADKAGDQGKIEAQAKQTWKEQDLEDKQPVVPTAVLITTSLLSRGLDFAPSVKNVLIMDEPQNMVDFVHRAGRTGRAGAEGKVILFGKGGKRSESSYLQELRTRAKTLRA